MRARLLARWVAIGALAARSASAQEARPDEVGAAALAEDAERLFDEKRYDEACPRFREAARASPPGLGALGRMAECYEAAGRTASAWSAWREVAAGTQAAGQTERLYHARKRITELEPILPRLTLAVPASARVERLQIHRDEVLVAEAQWDLAVPLDPGVHRVRASAPGHDDWEKRLEITAGNRVTLPVPRLRLTRREPPHDDEDGGAQRIVGVSAGSAGLAVGTVGAVLHLVALASFGVCPEAEGEARCPSEDDRSTYEAGQAELQAAFAFYGIGGVAVIAGVVLYLTAPEPSAAALSIRVTPGGAVLAGSW